MFVIIIGGGRTGTQLATLLLEQNHLVHLVEYRRDVLSRIHRELPTEIIYEGYFINPEVLEQAEIHKADVLAACTANDEENLVACYLARVRYGVARTIARVNNPRNAWLFDDKFHVDVALSNAEIMAKLIEEEMSMGDMMTLLKLRRGDYSLVEEKIPSGARAIGVPIKDMKLPDNCIIAAIIRNGKVILPRGLTTLEVDDEVLAITDSEGAEQLTTLFSPSHTPRNGESGLTKPAR
jgi:trk system potassium uptake protein TrkA